MLNLYLHGTACKSKGQRDGKFLGVYRIATGKVGTGQPRRDKLMGFVGFNEVDWRLYETAGFSYRLAECSPLFELARTDYYLLKKLSTTMVRLNCPRPSGSRAGFNTIFSC